MVKNPLATDVSTVLCNDAGCNFVPGASLIIYHNGSDFTYETWMGSLMVDNGADMCFFGTSDSTIQDFGCQGSGQLRGLCQFDCPGTFVLKSVLKTHKYKGRSFELRSNGQILWATR